MVPGGRRLRGPLSHREQLSPVEFSSMKQKPSSYGKNSRFPGECAPSSPGCGALRAQKPPRCNRHTSSDLTKHSFYFLPHFLRLLPTDCFRITWICFPVVFQPAQVNAGNESEAKSKSVRANLLTAAHLGVCEQSVQGDKSASAQLTKVEIKYFNCQVWWQGIHWVKL